MFGCSLVVLISSFRNSNIYAIDNLRRVFIELAHKWMLTSFFAQYCILDSVCCSLFSLSQELLVMLFCLIFKCVDSGINDSGSFTVAAYPALLLIPLIGFYGLLSGKLNCLSITLTRRKMSRWVCSVFLLWRMRGSREKYLSGSYLSVSKIWT